MAARKPQLPPAPSLQAILPTLSEELRAINPQLVEAARPGRSLAFAAHPDDRPVIEAREKKRAANVRRGRAAQANGSALEDIVEEALAMLGDVVAHYSRHDARKIERAGMVVGRVPGACDFTGITRMGRGFAIECKSGEQVHLVPELVPAGSRNPKLTAEQREQLVAYDGAHCPALLAVRDDDGVLLVPWRRVHRAVLLETAALETCRVDDVERWLGLHIGGGA